MVPRNNDNSIGALRRLDFYFNSKTSFSSLYLSSCHEKATEALCIERIQTRLGVALVSEFSARILLLTSSILLLGK